MFTGLVEERGVLVAVEPTEGGARLTLRAAGISAELAVGDSVSVSGACLTTTGVAPPEFSVEAIAETLRRTSLGSLVEGDEVNLEPALRLGDRMGGHIVQGHVDGLARVVSARREGESVVLRLEADPALARYVVEKGSVALDGVSLTVSARLDRVFEVALIPHTMAETTLGEERKGHDLNLEVDALAKYVEALTAPYRGPDHSS